MKTMIPACPFRCGLLFLSVLLASPGHAADTPDQTLDKPSLAFDGWDAFVERAMADWKVPGLALAVVRDGYDRLLEREPIDWSGRMKADRDKATRAAKGNSKKAADRQEGTTPSHPLSAYAGRYEHPAFGPITIRHAHGTLAFES